MGVLAKKLTTNTITKIENIELNDIRYQINGHYGRYQSSTDDFYHLYDGTPEAMKIINEIHDNRLAKNPIKPEVMEGMISMALNGRRAHKRQIIGGVDFGRNYDDDHTSMTHMVSTPNGDNHIKDQFILDSVPGGYDLATIRRLAKAASKKMQENIRPYPTKTTNCCGAKGVVCQ